MFFPFYFFRALLQNKQIFGNIPAFEWDFGKVIPDRVNTVLFCEPLSHISPIFCRCCCDSAINRRSLLSDNLYPVSIDSSNTKLEYFSSLLFLIDSTNLHFDRVFPLNNKIFPTLTPSVPSCSILENLNEKWIVNRTYQGKLPQRNVTNLSWSYITFPEEKFLKNR